MLLKIIKINIFEALKICSYVAFLTIITLKIIVRNAFWDFENIYLVTFQPKYYLELLLHFENKI